MASQVSWRFDFHQPPHSCPGAQAIWASGQWQYIAFTKGGIPLHNLCGEECDALQNGEKFDKMVAMLETKALNAASQHDDETEQRSTRDIDRFILQHQMALCSLDDDSCPQNYTIYAFGNDPSNESCVLVKPDGTLVPTVMDSYGDALTMAEGLSSSGPAP